jgi:hypothetical protein
MKMLHEILYVFMMSPYKILLTEWFIHYNHHIEKQIQILHGCHVILMFYKIAREQSPSEANGHSVKKFPTFMEAQSYYCTHNSQVHYPTLCEVSAVHMPLPYFFRVLYAYNISLLSISSKSSHPLGIQTEIVYAFLFSSMCATCSAHLHHLDFISRKCLLKTTND